MWLKSKRDSRVKSFLTKIFPFLKRNGRWKHSRLDKNDDLSGSKWSFISSATTDIVELQEPDLLGNVPTRNIGCRGGKVNLLPLTGTEQARSQNGKPEQRPKKKVKKFRLRIRFGKRKRASSDVGGKMRKFEGLIVDNIKEADDNLANEERIRQMAIASEPVPFAVGDNIKTSTCGKRKAPYATKKETKKRTTKARDRFKNKRTRKDNYESIEDELFGSDETITNDKAVPGMSLALECKAIPDQGTWNVEFNRQLSDSIWCPETMAPCNRSMECLQPKPAKNGRKRPSKTKQPKAKKITPNRYEKLNCSIDQLERVPCTENKGTSCHSKQVKGGAWKMCKNGWKTMKSGLVYYSKAPVIKATFNPVLTRYEDGFKEFQESDVS